MKKIRTLFYQDIECLIGRNTLSMIALFAVLFSSLEAYNVYVRIFFAIIVILCGGIIKFADKQSFWLLLFSISYIVGLTINSNYAGRAGYISHLFCPVIFYLYGKKIVSTCNFLSELTTFLLLCILLFGFDVYINTISDISHGILLTSSRIGNEEESIMAATLQSATVSLGIVGLAAFCFFQNPIKNFKAKLYGLTFIMSILAITHQISRTGLVISVFCTFIVVAYKWRYNILKIILLLSIVSFSLWLLSKMSVFNGEIMDAYISRHDDLDQSMGMDGGRIYRWRDALSMMISHPEGWTSDYMYIHNLWLDTQRLAGIIPFLALTIITILGIKNQIHLMSLKDNSFVAITLGLNICMLLTAFVEPILQGAATYVYFMFLLWGMQAQYLESYVNIDTNE